MAWDVTRLSRMKLVNPGTASVSATATTINVIINSTNVKPECFFMCWLIADHGGKVAADRVCGGIRPTSGG